MPRTPLLSHLVDLASASRSAGELGTDAAEVLGRRAEALASDEGLTRCDLLKRAALAGAGATVLGRLVLEPERAFGAGLRPKPQPRIAVVGAGLSGLTAAMTLKDAGFKHVTVYESSDRVGGRTYTRSGDGFWQAGQWSEWGGELIDTDHELVFALCDRFGFGLIDGERVAPKRSNDILHFDGGYYPWDDMVDDWKHGGVDKAIKRDMRNLPEYPWAYDDPAWTPAGLALDGMSLYDWIETRIPGGHSSRLGQFIDVAYVIEYGEDTHRQGASDLLSLLGFPVKPFWVFGASDERWRIDGGNQQLSLAQADYVGAPNIRFGWSLTALARNADGTVTATFDTGGPTSTVTADEIVLAIPLGVMKRIKAAGGFAGAFGGDTRKLDSIDAQGFGANNKLHLQIADRFWIGSGPWGNSNGESFADTGFQLAWHGTVGQPGTTGILVDYTGGDISRLLNPSKAWSDTSDPSPAARAYVENAADAFLAQIEPVFPGMTARWTGKATLAAWHVNTHSYGAYSYWVPDYLHRFSTYEAVSIGPIHFAGEHVSSDWPGYLEGAAGEGQRAAMEIVDTYR